MESFLPSYSFYGAIQHHQAPPPPPGFPAYMPPFHPANKIAEISLGTLNPDVFSAPPGSPQFPPAPTEKPNTSIGLNRPGRFDTPNMEWLINQMEKYSPKTQSTKLSQSFTIIVVSLLLDFFNEEPGTLG